MQVEPPTSNSSGDSAFPACRTSHPTTKAYSAPDLLCPQATLKLSRGRVEGKSPRPLLFCRVASAAPNYLPWRGRPAPACHTYPPPGDCSKPVSPATLSTEAPFPHPCLHRKKKKSKLSPLEWLPLVTTTYRGDDNGRSLGLRLPRDKSFQCSSGLLVHQNDIFGRRNSRAAFSDVRRYHRCPAPLPGLSTLQSSVVSGARVQPTLPPSRPQHQLSSACTRRRLTSFLSTPASHLHARQLLSGHRLTRSPSPR